MPESPMAPSPGRLSVGRKRRRTGGEERGQRTGGEESDDQGGPLRKVLSTGGFACPFFKRDPFKYVDCLGYTTTCLARNVRQHITRYHQRPRHFCPICGDTFIALEPLNLHIRAQTCQMQDVSHHSGMDSDQQSKINKIIGNRGSGKTEDEKWYEMWEVLFPGQNRPASTKRGCVEEEMAFSLQRFMQTSTVYPSMRTSFFPDLQGKVEWQQKIDSLFHAVLDAWAKSAGEARGSAASVDSPLGDAYSFQMPSLDEALDEDACSFPFTPFEEGAASYQDPTLGAGTTSFQFSMADPPSFHMPPSEEADSSFEQFELIRLEDDSSSLQFENWNAPQS